jgi:hypothetical protein
VGNDTTLGDDDGTEELWWHEIEKSGVKGRTHLAQLFVVPDGELQVTGHDTVLLVVTGSVASELENLGSEVFEDSGEVDWKQLEKNGQAQDTNVPGAPAPTR